MQLVVVNEARNLEHLSETLSTKNSLRGADKDAAASSVCPSS